MKTEPPLSAMALTFAVIILVLLASFPLEAKTSPQDASEQTGRRIFEQRCTLCHTVGLGKKVGPDLNYITGLRSRTWLVDFISDPAHMYRVEDPRVRLLLEEFRNIRMPNLQLSADEIADVLSYLGSVTIVPRPVAAKALPSRPVLQGGKLFTGVVAFKNGGAPCVSCHHISGISFPGGGTLGPDLTDINPKFGATAARTVMVLIPFRTMVPIFANRPLTQEEEQDLEAFFEILASESPVNMAVPMGLMAEGVSLLLLLVVWVIWRSRLVGVRKALVDKASATGGPGS